MEAALDDIRQNKISFRQAAAKYNIQKSTLCDYTTSTADAVWPWVAYDYCDQWYHAECTDIDPELYPDLDTIDWVCKIACKHFLFQIILYTCLSSLTY